MNASDAKPKRRPRISLLSLLLLMALAVTSLTTAMLWRELATLRPEVKRYRDELGALTITDSGKAQAIRVETTERLTWKWRLRLPPGREYWFKRKVGQVPGEGVPNVGGSSLGAGEYLVTLAIRRDPTTEAMTGQYKIVGSGSRFESWCPHPWAENDYPMLMFNGVEYQSVERSADEPFVLARNRYAEDGEPIGVAADDLRPGFMIWIEPRR